MRHLAFLVLFLFSIISISEWNDVYARPGGGGSYRSGSSSSSSSSSCSSGGSGGGSGDILVSGL